MARTSAGREKVFLDALVKSEGRSRRGAFEFALCKSENWTNDVFSAVLGALVQKGLIISRRGGRSIELTSIATHEEISVPPIEIQHYASERDLYDPIYNSIRLKWAVERGYDTFICEPSHSKGSAPTGGKFSRPDITLVGSKSYVHLPGKYFEVVTFEVKAAYDVNVLGVLEALAHRDSAHRSYAIYHVTSEKFDDTENADRIESMAEKHGIGLILAADPKDGGTWETRVEAKRVEPDPERVDNFIGGLREKTNRENILKMHK